MYVHPFGDTVPGSDGKNYARSFSLGANGNSAFNVTGGDCMLSRLKIGGMAIADSAVLGFPAATFHYCVQLFCNNNRVSDCYLYNGAKHMLAVNNGASNKGAFIDLVDAEQGSIYTPGGGQTPFVTYADTSGVNPTGMTAYFKSCTCLQNEGIVGATSGTVDFRDPVWYAHNGGVGQQWAN